MGGVPAPARLRLVERRAEPDGDEHVLERHPCARVRVDVAGGDRRDPEPLGELREQAVAPAVAAAVGALQLDTQVVAAEDLGEALAGRPRRRVPGPLDSPRD